MKALHYLRKGCGNISVVEATHRAYVFTGSGDAWREGMNHPTSGKRHRASSA